MLPLVAWITVGLIGLVSVGLIAWDIYVATNDIPNRLDTISGRMKDWGKKALILPWLWAMLFGHFWGPLKAGQFLSGKVGIGLLVACAWTVVIAGAHLRQNGMTITSSWLLFFFILNFGALCGALLWPQ